MSYTIKLEQGRYLIVNDNGSLTILRHGEDWPAADQLKHVKILGAMAARIEELEVAIRAVVDGSLRPATGARNEDGTSTYLSRMCPPRLDHTGKWDTALRNALKQGE